MISKTWKNLKFCKKTFLNFLIPKMRFYSKVIMPPDPDDERSINELLIKNEKKTESKSEFFCLFFALTAKLKKLRMLSKNKHHIRKEHVPTRWGMDFSGDLSIFSRKIITTICDKITGILVWNVTDCESETKILVHDQENNIGSTIFNCCIWGRIWNQRQRKHRNSLKLSCLLYFGRPHYIRHFEFRISRSDA